MVTIIVPVYNIKKYLPGCVQSLLRQSHEDLEILLIDDGSTDGGGALCDSLAASDRRITAVHKANGGLSDARNAGLDRARGDWILFVDGDDYLAPDAVARLLEHAQPDVDFVQFLYKETEDTDWLPDPDQSAEPVACHEIRQFFDRLYDMGGVAASSCTKLWNRRIFDGVRFREGILHEDEELLNRVLPCCRKVIYTDLILYGYVMRGGSIVRGGFKPKHLDVFSVMDDRIRVLENMGFDDLVLRTKARLALTALLRFCDAKRGGFIKEAGQLKKRFLILCREKGIPLSGQYKLVCKLTRILPVTPELYYLARRICGKI